MSDAASDGPESRPSDSDRNGRAEASRASQVAIFVAVIGLVGSLSTLLITDFLQQRERRRLEEEQAYIQLGNAVVAWEQAITVTEQALLDLYDTYTGVRESDDDAELLRGWRESYRSTLGSLSELDTNFSSVREAREMVYFNADGDGIARSERLYQAARNRRLYLRHVFGMIPTDPRTRLSPAAQTGLRTFEVEADADFVFGEPVPDDAVPTTAQCPDLSTVEGGVLVDEQVLRFSYPCLVQTHLAYIEDIATLIAD